MNMNLPDRTGKWIMVCIALILMFLTAFSSCNSDVGKVKEKILTITDTNLFTGTNLSWTAPVTYNDGSGLTVDSYRLYYKTSPASFPSFTIISDATATTYDAAQVINTRGVTYYFYLTAIDAAGVEGDPSNEVHTYAP